MEGPIIVTRAGAALLAVAGAIWTYGSWRDPAEVYWCASVALGASLMAFAVDRPRMLALGSAIGVLGPMRWLAEAAARGTWDSYWIEVGIGAALLALAAMGDAFRFWRGRSAMRVGGAILALAGLLMVARDGVATLSAQPGLCLLAAGAAFAWAPPGRR